MNTRHRWFGTLGWRLLAAFLTVTVGAVALLALVAAVSVDRRTSALVDAQRAQLREQVAAALATAYTAGRGSWQPNGLAGVQALATAHDAHVTVRDNTGHQVTSLTPGHHDSWAPPTTPPSSPPTTLHRDTTPTGPAPQPTHQDQSTPGMTRSSPHPTSTQRWSPGSETPHSGTPDGDRHARPATTTGGRAVGLAAAPGPLVAPVAAAGPAPAAAPDPAPVAAPSPQPSTMTVPIVVDGARVGTAEISLPSGADAAVTAARDALLRTVGIGAALAVLLAAVAAVFVTRSMSRPLVALATATRSFAAGDPNPERLLQPAPGELGDVARSFTAMAASVRRQDELRRAVVADVAHELRTPVTILRGQTEQLLDGIAPPTTAALVSLHDEVLRLQRLTDDLATLSAADAAGLALHTAPVDLAKLTRGAVEAMSATFDDAGLPVELDTADPVVVDGDATRLTQVVTNLLTNAAKFTPAGGTVTVTLGRDGTDAVLTVADTGPGIPADELPHLFERFWRGRAAGSRSGTGIGLAVVHALVTAHGGTVTADSPASGGARFTVRQPTVGGAGGG